MFNRPKPKDKDRIEIDYFKADLRRREKRAEHTAWRLKMLDQAKKELAEENK